MPLPKAPAHPAEILEDYGTPATPESERKLPDVKIVEEHGGTEYTVTGSYEGTETLDRKLRRIMEQNAADDKNGITEDADE